MKNFKKLILLILAVLLFVFGGCRKPTADPGTNPDPVIVDPVKPETPDPVIENPDPVIEIAEDGTYTTKEDVSLYLHVYGRLPDNFITKSEARKLGWTSGGLDKYAPGMCIGGDRFGNYEGILPDGYKYYECDIDTLHQKSRGAKRLVFTYEGTIYYTDDHYSTFELLYEGEKK